MLQMASAVGLKRAWTPANTHANSCQTPNPPFKTRAGKETGIDPKQVLNEAFLNTDNEGSSTACIITLLGDFLHAVNIGDSGFVLIRGGRIVFASPSQQRRFNCPYQLGNTSDCPSLAAEFRVGVEVGDIVVVGTDGLFDNVFGRDIEDLVILGEQVGFCEDKPEVLAQIIAKCALGKSKDKNGSSPFASAASEAGYEYVEGKPDDITVVVGYIVQGEEWV